MAKTIESQVVLSFAMKEGGHAFSVWLRDQLMKRLGWFDPLAVYLDTAASRELPMPRSGFLLRRPEPTVRLDQRSAMQPAGRTDGPNPLGVQRKDWDSNFGQALASAKAIIFVLNENFAASKWCGQELSQAQEENRRRGEQHRSPLKLVVLDFFNSSYAKSFFPGATFVKTTAVSGNGEALLWSPGQWKIDEQAMTDLVRALR